MKIDGVKITGPVFRNYKEILTPDAVRFAAKLAREFETRRQTLLTARDMKQREIDSGKLPTFLKGTEDIRNSDWIVAPIVPPLEKRHVEITGPVDRKMIINALNSGANVFMADFEDSNSPSWRNNIEGQINLRDAVDGTITYSTGKKDYALGDDPATLMVRPRGWHLNEDHMTVDGKPISAALFDFGLYFYHNAKKFVEKNGSGPYFYLPKIEHHEEAKLWDDVFRFAQNDLGIPEGSVRATVLIETILAAFEMDEILHSLKDHSAGLNAGRWDYLFSFIKKFRNNPKFVLPDRSELTMDKPPLAPYAGLLVQTAHKRGIHAMGGMAAQVPIKGDIPANERALATVRADKEREASLGHDGAWVAHPGLVPIVGEIFENALGDKPHQIDNSGPSEKITPKQLLKVPKGKITENGLRTNVRATILYLAPWLNEVGCVAIDHKMEDAATVEISRSQVWQQLEHKAKLDDGRKVTVDLVKQIVKEELSKVRESMDNDEFQNGKYELAAKLFEDIVTNRKFSEFLTTEAYPYVQTHETSQVAETKNEFASRLTARWNSPRWEGKVRPYTAEDVFSIRGTVNEGYGIAKSGAEKLWNLVNTEDGVRVLSAVTGNQAIQEVQAGLKAIYVSGWQVAADANDSLQMYPDQSLYAVNSAPMLARRINNALVRTDQIHHMDGKKAIDWMVPLVVDGESGFGGSLNTFELMKAMIEAGASGVHFEDQLASAKKCGHMGGKVIVPTGEFVNKLASARLAADSMGVETVLIARTDANSGGLITSDVDDNDKPFVDYEQERTPEGFYNVKAGIDQAISRGLAYAPYADMLWFETSTPDMDEARKFADAIHAKYPGQLLAYNCSPSFNWVLNFMMKQVEFYSVRDFTIDANVKEAIKNVAQLVIKDGEKAEFDNFEHKNERVQHLVRSMGKEIKDEDGIIDFLISSTNEKIASFQDDLNRMGYKFQFVTLSGFHVLNLSTFNLAQGYREKGMLAYSNLQQDEFAAAADGYRATAHQGFVGTGYFDKVAQIVSSGNASTLALKDSTEEHQF